MRHFLIVLVLLTSYGGIARADGETDPAKAAIQQTIDAYLAAFNQGDAAMLANLWTPQGEMIGPDGDRTQGRDQIRERFAAVFAAGKHPRLELADTKIEVQSPSTAVETGVARVIVADEEPEQTEYRVVHVKTADGWKIDSVREAEVDTPAPSHYEYLKPLAGMVGQWSDNDENADVESSCRWSRNQNFLIQSFRVLTNAKVDFEGTQIIGWDPREKTIRSWMFDSDGGFGVGRWSRNDKGWTVRTVQVLPDGRTGSATNVYELIDPDTVSFRSVGRQVEGDLLPSVGPITIVRTKQAASLDGQEITQ